MVQSIFLCDVLGTELCAVVPKATAPQTFVLLLVSGTFFFSYLRDKWDLHFPLNTKWFCLFPPRPRISDIWSNSNLFSYVTFSNNWALALAELVPTISEGKSPRFYSLLQVNRRGWYTVLLEFLSLLIIFGHTQKLLYRGFWVDSVKGWFSFWVMISPLSGLHFVAFLFKLKQSTCICT